MTRPLLEQVRDRGWLIADAAATAMINKMKYFLGSSGERCSREATGGEGPPFKRLLVDVFFSPDFLSERCRLFLRVDW